MLGDQAETNTLVGRAAELATLHELVGEVASGSAALLTVSGPSGLGKSRLAREATRLATAAGFAAATSRPTEYGPELAFAAAVDAFGPLLRARPPQARAELAGDLPQLGLLFAGVDLVPPAPLADAALQRSVLVESLCRMVDRLSRQRPLLWVVDGCDTIDGASIEVLQRCATPLADRPMLLVLTGTGTAAGAGSSVVRACGDCAWRRERIRLEPLSEPEAATLAEEVLGAPLAPELAATMQQLCAGTPLYVVATAQALVESDLLTERAGRLALAGPEVPLPTDVRDQLQDRMDRLGSAERTVLVALSVAGGPLQPEVLARFGDLDVEATPEVLGALERHRLGAWTTGGYDVVHGLLREVVLTGLTETGRRTAHARLARALRDRDVDDPGVAEHALRAGALAGTDLVPRELVRGGQRARSVGATADAYSFLSAALIAYPRDALSQPGVPPRADLDAEVAELAAELGDRPAARRHWNQALAGYSEAGAAVGVARTQRRLAQLEWAEGRLGAAREHLDLAERALDGLEPGPELGEVYYARTTAAQRTGDADAVRRETGRLEALARRTGSATLAARAHLAAAALAYTRTDYAEMSRHNAEALRAADATADAALLVRVHDQISVAAASQGRVGVLREHSLASAALADASGTPLLGMWPRARLAFADLLTGRLDAALRTSAELVGATERYRPPRGAASCFAGHALLLTHHGHLREARAFLRRSLDAPAQVLDEDRNVTTIVEYAAARLALAEGDPAQAQRAGHRLGDLAGGWVPLLGAALLAEAYADGGLPERADALAARIGGVRSCITSLPDTLAHWINGLTAADHTRAADHLGAAVDGFEELELLLPANHARLRLATRPGVPEPVVVDAAQQALAFFEKMGAPVPARRARDLLRALGVVVPRSRAQSSTGGPLSSRELEVARLVAGGLSNAAVATELFISPRTVTTHLEHIYAKLELSSRVALTRYLADSDLLEAADPRQPAATQTTDT